MSIKDKTEQILRDIYIMLSESDAFEGSEDKIIINKNDMVDLLNRLNVCIYGMMDEYGISQRGRDKMERDMKKAGEDIIKDANRGAEDIYAAAFLYTDEALRRVLDIMQETTQSVKSLCNKVEQDFQKEKDSVKRNKLELRSQLRVFRDTDKYLKLIDEQNKAIEKAKKKEQKEQEESSPYAKIKPEIKVNPAYFEKIGMPLDEVKTAAGQPVSEVMSGDTALETRQEEGITAGELPKGEIFGEETDFEEPKEKIIPEIKINLDAEYFKWKESGLKIEEEAESEEEKSEGKRTLFSKIRK